MAKSNKKTVRRTPKKNARKINEKTDKKASKKSSFTFPQHVLKPVQDFLTGELKKLSFRKKQAEEEDPFSDSTRLIDNAAEDTEAAEQFGHARSEAIKNHLDMRIVQVRKALTRIKLGRYGICEKCGNFIDTKRLMIFPETTVCIRCEQKRTKKR